MKSIRRQLTRELILALSLLLGAGLVAIYITTRIALRESFDNALRARAVSLASLVEIEQGKVSFDFSSDLLASYGGRNEGRNFFEIWDQTGVVLSRSPSLRTTDLPLLPTGSAEKPRYRNLTLPDGRSGRIVEISFIPEPTDSPTLAISHQPVRLAVASDREEFDEALDGLVVGFVGCGALLAAAVAWLVPRVLRRGLTPLDRLGERAAQIDATSLATRFAADEMPVELRTIAQRLNDLLARLEASFERERQFSADLAHELRTPLAELRSLAECAIKWPETRDAATDHDALAIAAQMESLVTRLLTLARGERGQLAVTPVEVDLDGLVRDVWKPFAARAEARHVTVRWELAAGRATCDAALMRSVLGNLFDNAADYAPANGELFVSVSYEGGAPTVRVANLAPDLAPGDAARLFDRFWRKEAARAGGGAHLGLGLPLARAFAAAMGWSLSAEVDSAGRLVFTLQAGGSAK